MAALGAATTVDGLSSAPGRTDIEFHTKSICSDGPLSHVLDFSKLPKPEGACDEDEAHWD